MQHISQLVTRLVNSSRVISNNIRVRALTKTRRVRRSILSQFLVKTLAQKLALERVARI